MAPGEGLAQSTTRTQGAFGDDEGSVHEPALDALAGKGYLADTECGEKLICPSQPLQRWEMAVWLGRALTGNSEPPAITSSRFADVDAGQWWAPHVERFAELEITTGCSTEPLRYCPYNAVTRAQMASFLARAYKLSEAASAAGFTDIAGNVHAGNIDALAAASVTTGCRNRPLRYCPRNPVTRAQMATFIARASGLIEKPSSPPAERYVAVVPHWSQTCAIHIDEKVDCWGSDTHGKTRAPSGSFKSISAGYQYMCGIRTDGRIACWGSGTYGRTDAPSGTFKSITAGSDDHKCAIRTDDTIACWGHNDAGQADSPSGRFKSVRAGFKHNCAIRIDDALVCWGWNRYGQTEAPSSSFKSTFEGAEFSICGIRTDGRITCWGSNNLELFGNELLIAPSGTFNTIATGDSYNCGIRTDGTITCWGWDSTPHFANKNERYGLLDPPAGTFKTIVAGHDYMCGLRTNNEVACWGMNNYGQTDVPAGTFKTIAANRALICGIRTDDTLTCWGNNEDNVG